MIYLFYSEFCDHCKILLDTIKKHDKVDTLKLVSIDNLRARGIKLNDNKTCSCYTEKFIYGKEVFDYLLLPGHGILLTGNTDKSSSENLVGEPVGMNSYIQQNYENLEDENVLTGTSGSQWEQLNTDLTNNSVPLPLKDNSDEDKEHKKLPSMEDIMKRRQLEIT